MGAYNVGLRDMLGAGGFTLGLLAILSIYTYAVVWERWRYFKKALEGLPELLRQLRGQIEAGDLHEATKSCKRHPGAGANVVLACLVGSPSKAARQKATERALEREAAELEKRLSALATIGSTAPFIGLFGTVLGVIRAFKDLASAAAAGPGVVAVGISEALWATAAGLFVAIPAIIAYNYFTTRANHFADELRWITEELLDRLTEKH